ncbi:uncharacterized protein LOC128033842 isoform X2 [Gossypium raimondii]|uniref:uncharacterized protein LOC128033842 isoform X2 n=1 Tax=Gossypium raimondii TaxID=29730 RepID=UPI00227ABB97|nr:uncharacterized protein LOC128033842 isoform X2 [Gossypium raimondii]
MEVLPHFSHVHPLVFNDGRSHESEEVYCCACGELVSGPRFSCVDCGFHLDKNCAEAPVEMNHPFHRQHNLKLMKSSPYVEAHLSCILRGEPFLKRGIKIKESDHPHTLMIVEKVYDYPECHKCGHRCMDLALECLDAECKYIIHWKCSTTFQYFRSA